jgi:hypothetical protein
MHRIAKSGLMAAFLLGVLSLTCHRRVTQRPSPPAPQTTGAATTHEMPPSKEAPTVPAPLSPSPADTSTGSPRAGASPAPENPPPEKEVPSGEPTKRGTEGAGQDLVPPHGGTTPPDDKGRQTADGHKGMRPDPGDPRTNNPAPQGSNGEQQPGHDPAGTDRNGQQPAGDPLSGTTGVGHVNGALLGKEPGRADEGRWYWKDLWLVLFGAVVSLYTTVVFERYKRFGELMRTVARNRQNFEGEAHSPNEAHLKRAHEKSMAFYGLLEETVWSLDTDGQHKAAAEVGRLQTFIFQATACVENMLAKQTKGLKLDQYLSEYTMIFGEVYHGVFGRFEDHIRPEIAPLLRPYPHPVMRRKATAIVVRYFDKLL